MLGTSIRAIRNAKARKAIEAATQPPTVRPAAEVPSSTTLDEIDQLADEPLIAERTVNAEELPTPETKMAPAAVQADMDALEAAGFRVDREVFEAPAAMDGKRRFGVTRQALDAEGTFGDRWTKIETKAEEWPELPPNTKSLRGQAGHVWRNFAKSVYDKIRGQYTVDKTGENYSCWR